MPNDGVRDATAYARFKTQSKRVGSHQFDDTTSLAVPPADVCAGASNADSERDERGRPKSRLSQVRHSLADNAQVSRAHAREGNFDLEQPADQRRRSLL